MRNMPAHRGRAPSLAARSLVALVALLAGPGARAHEVHHSVERGRAVAVRAYYSDGEALALARYEVHSPAETTTPHQQGRTDRGGWLAFVPDAPGRWRVKVVERSGHGLDVEVEIDAATGAAVEVRPVSTLALVLRPILGLAAVGAVFSALVLVRRRRGTPPC